MYKYRGTSSFRFLVDILLKKRLYAAPYLDLNDPMEGHYLMSSSGKIDEDMRLMLKSAQDRIRICSLSRSPDDPLMWAHYAEGHRGVVVGVDITDPKCEVRPILYDGPMKIGLHNFNASSPIDVLSRKLAAWEYEAEERAFVRSKYFIEVIVHELILGSRVSNQDKSFMTELCSKICPEVRISDA